jgi:sugar lactone lactonase YvrE
MILGRANSRRAIHHTIATWIAIAGAAGCKDSSPLAELDETPPGVVTDFQVIEVEPAALTLSWIAPGDDGSAGTVIDYDIRVASQPFTEATWTSATRFVSALVPRPAGIRESVRIPWLFHAHTYYVAVRAVDDFFNVSPASPVVTARTANFGATATLPVPFGPFSAAAVDDAGNIYCTATSQNLVQVFSSAGAPLHSWGGEGPELGHFHQPYGIAVGNGFVYVADTFNQRVQVFEPNGTVRGAIGANGLGDGEFRRPMGVAVDPGGNIYVTDTLRERVQVFDRQARFLAGWGMVGPATGMFRTALGVAADAAGNVFVLDQENRRVQRFDRQGNFLDTWGGSGSTPGKFGTATSIAVDADGSVYVTDEGRGDFQKFTPHGVWLGAWPTGMSDSRPLGIALHATGRAIVCFRESSTLMVFDATTAVD